MSANLEVTILGCGSSGGVPRVGGDWGACDPDEPRNRRTRCSLWVEYWETESGPDSRTRIIIDTSPDLREQLLSIDAKRVDAVLFTHEHADQTHGIDDLRALAYRMRNRIPTFMDAPTKAHLWTRFKYCFETPEGRVHPPILELGDQLEPGKTIHVDGPGGCLPIEVVGLSHGPSPSLGFIFDGKIAYTPDVHDIDDTALEALTGLDVWVMDALRYSPHPTHAHADKALSWIARTKTQKAVLTNLHIDMDYASLKDELPGSHDVAYDGMKIQL
jgi:phosphoribosyl 1,2-cyclic phosphate phosphodiesterase